MRKQEEGRTALLKAARQSPAHYTAVAAALIPQHFKVSTSSRSKLPETSAKLFHSGVDPDLLGPPRESFPGHFRSGPGRPWSHCRAATTTSRRHLPQPIRAKKSRDCRGSCPSHNT